MAQAPLCKVCGHPHWLGEPHVFEIEPPPQKRRRGRPRIEEKDQTFAALQPWSAAGMSRRTWYRRQKEKK